LTDTDRIQKTVLLRAPIARVWSAISDATQFGSWFGVAFDGPFAPGKLMAGKVVPTTVDPEVAKMQEPHAGASFELTVDRVEPMALFSFRWHPFAIDPAVDYSGEPTTLVTFELVEVAEGTQLTITESGFDGIPLHRRGSAFEMNANGWAAQVQLVEKFVTRGH
jgi:uncharacterized protein YndB with AHSA1/START domain